MGAAVHWRAYPCIVALAIGSPSLAAPVDGRSEEQPDAAPLIVITGSRIPRADLNAVSPVTTVDGYEFKLQGTTNSEELLNWLPQVNPSQGEFVTAAASGAATINLRGLGAVRTLVLVNGRRLMPGDPRFLAADVNSIPTAIIQRVEVLTGGAAAVYGSDAIAGVVNYILDTKLDGVRFEGQIGAFQHNNRDEFVQSLLDQSQLPYPKGNVLDGRRENLSMGFGHGFFDNRAHVTLYAGYRHIEAVRQNQRDYSSCPINARTAQQKPTDVLVCGGPIVSFPGNYFDNFGNIYQVTDDRTFVPGVTRFNSAAWNLIQRPDKRFTFGGFASFDVSKGVQPYAEVMGMKDRSTWKIGPSGDFTNTQTINCDNPLLSAQQKSLICKTGNFVGESLDFDDDGTVVVVGGPTQFPDPITGGTYNRAALLIARRSIEGGPIEDELEHKSIRLLGGLTGDAGRGVSYDASYLFGRVNLDREYRNNISVKRLERALDVVSDPETGAPICRSALIARELGVSAGADPNCVPWDVFATGQVTPQSVAYLSIPPHMDGSFTEQVGNLNASIQLDRWGIGSPWSDEASLVNVGTEFRRAHVEFDPHKFADAGDIAGFGEQVFPIHGSIETKEIFGEARIPLVTHREVERLSFEGGFRKSWYRNSRSKFSSEAYKVALDLTAVRGLRFRASQQGANRAPNVQELFAPIQPDGFFRDPCAGPAPTASATQCAGSGVTAAQYGHVAIVNESRFGYRAILGGNEHLQPENATTRTFGLALQPRFMRGFNATIDWWDINLKNAISTIGAQAIVDSCVASGDPVFCSRIHRDPNGSLWLTNGYVDDRLVNLGGIRTRGIDGTADYSAGFGRLGSASIEFRGSYVLHWIVDNGGLSTPYDCAGLFGAPCGIQPRWKHTARATWDAPHGISLSFQWRHMSSLKLAALDPRFGLTDDVSPANTKLGTQNYLDVATVFRLRKQLELRIGVNNLLDRQPPLVVGNTAAGVGPASGNTYPQWYDPLGRYLFATVAAAFKP